MYITCAAHICGLSFSLIYLQLINSNQGLRQRSKTVIDCVARLRSLSYDLLANHQKTVIDFVNDLEESRLAPFNHSNSGEGLGGSSGPDTADEMMTATSGSSKNVSRSESKFSRSGSPATFKLDPSESKSSRRSISSANGCRRR